jgi:hypothetical protein
MAVLGVTKRTLLLMDREHHYSQQHYDASVDNQCIPSLHGSPPLSSHSLNIDSSQALLLFDAHDDSSVAKIAGERRCRRVNTSHGGEERSIWRDKPFCKDAGRY